MAKLGVRVRLLMVGVSLVSWAPAALALPSGFAQDTIGTFGSIPTLIASAPDGRMFVGEKGGRVRVIKNHVLLATPFVSLSVSQDGERGVQGIAFHPSFALEKWVYVFYTNASPLENRVSRFRVSASNPDVADAASQEILLRIPMVNANIYHHGGSLEFGGDGKLYISVGDHRSSGTAQNTNDIHGKVLRLNADGTVPADNPTFGRREIWAYGFRNPWAMEVERGTGRIFVNDVGNAASGGREEINLLVRGSNYNWPNSEGPGSYYNYGAASQGGCAIVGGDFYNPVNVMFPSTYVGKYFYGDHCGGWIKYISAAGSPGTPVTFHTGLGANSITDIEVASDGSLYYGSRAGNVVRRVRYGSAPRVTPMPTPTPTPTPAAGGSPTAMITAPASGTQYSGGQTVAYSGTCTDPEDGTLPLAGYTWEVVFHHNAHTHEFVQPYSGAAGGSFTVPRDNESEHTVWFRIHLTCRDSSGRTHSSFRDVQPRVVTLTLATSPSGLQVKSDHASGASPLYTQAVVGVVREVGTSSPQSFGGTTYYFKSWSDAGALTHQVETPPANATYTATFAPASSYVEITPAAAGVAASGHDGNLPGNTVDGSLSTRWSANGDGVWIQYDLGLARSVGHAKIAFYNGTSRRSRFELQVSNDGVAWISVFSGESSGTTLGEETFDFTDVSARYVRYLGHGNNTNMFSSLTEVSLFGAPLLPVP